MNEGFKGRNSPSRRHDDETNAVIGYQDPAPQYVALEALPGRGGGEQDLLGAMRQLWRRRWLLIFVTLIGGGISASIVWSLPSFYVGEARLLVGLQGPRVLNVEATVADISPDAERVQNESFILQSRTIAAEVIDQLKLADNPSFNPELRKPSIWARVKLPRLSDYAPEWLHTWIEEVIPEAPPAPALTAAQRENRLIDLLVSRIDVATLGRSHVLSIKAEAPDASTAAAIANAFAEKYVDLQRRDKVSTMDRVDKFLMERIDELRDQVRKSDQAVEDYRKAHDLYKSGTGSVTTQQLSELNMQLMAAQAGKVEAEMRLKEAQALGKVGLTGETVPEVLRSPLIAALTSQHADTERRAAEAGASYGDRHPQLRSARAESASISARLSAEVAKIVEGLARDARSAAARYAALLDQFERLKSHMGGVNDKSIQLEALEREAVVNRNLLEAMLNRAKQTMGTAAVVQANAKLISPAVPAEFPSYPPKALLVFLGSFAALLVGGAIALILEGNDRTFRRPEQIEALTGLPVLAMVPQIRSRVAAQQVLREPTSPYTEALRRLFLGVELSDAEASPKVLLFSSAIPAEGKSVMVASTGRLLAGAGKRVLLIDCDWRSPRLHRIFRCRNAGGLSTLLTDDQAVLNDCIHRDPQSGADIIPAGFWDPRLSHLLNSDRMADLLRLLASAYDVILLDSPPVLVTADALALSQFAQKVIYVVRWGHTRQDTALEGLKQFMEAQADVAGVVVSRVDVRDYRRHSYRDLNYLRAPVATFRQA